MRRYVMPVEYPRVIEMFPLAGLLEKTMVSTRRKCDIIQGIATVRTLDGTSKMEIPAEFGVVKKVQGMANTFEYHIGKTEYPSVVDAIERRDITTTYGEILSSLDKVIRPRMLTGGLPDVVIDEVVAIETAPPAYMERVGQSDIGEIAFHYVKRGNPRRKSALSPAFAHLSDMTKSIAATNLGIRLHPEVIKKIRSTLRTEFIAGVNDREIIGYEGVSVRGVGDLLTSMVGNRALNFDRDVACYHPVELSLDGKKRKLDAYQLMYDKGFVEKRAPKRVDAYKLVFNGGYVSPGVPA